VAFARQLGVGAHCGGIGAGGGQGVVGLFTVGVISASTVPAAEQEDVVAAHAVVDQAVADAVRVFRAGEHHHRVAGRIERAADGRSHARVKAEGFMLPPGLVS
jgi:hypothetical protein